ncbi:hypothetical protein LTR10_022558 [Elasticomyces elasticus]|uniref:Phytanoyl-CoA dioxygenase n=1 Tax=Exophiala sideris TaxID=1016849 RepID=A0ABR0J6J6_9EURO|nr:hypothetical protein LTR10_022558 [Elasticomyces elasticus]KAK5023525.1 hypothetical protein LTR13_011166 [Exophiala sideris]KAK5028661.1 hypothetical protein LTS07_006040 [Exophiala sideris]KAK5057165.1 hypothetical protein LTR69_007204 [Exophiala sideris]
MGSIQQSDIDSPLPQIVRVGNTASTEEIIKILSADGAVIIEDLVDPEILRQIESELKADFEAAEVEKATQKEGGGFQLGFPKLTERIEIMGRSETSDKLLMHPTVVSVLDGMLAEKFPVYFGKQLYHPVSKPQLAAALAIRCKPGNPAQGLHRDDTFNHTIHPGPESQVTAIWAGSKSTIENGATEAIPGSHLWGINKDPNEHRDRIVYAPLNVGSVLLVVGGLYHAGGANNTTDETRTIYTFFYNKGYLRQEENQYLNIPREVMRSKSVEIQEMLGYTVSKPGAGYYKGGDPKAWLRNPDLATQFMY